jgi:ABC-type bacteriocin/lantibiotic exporter with double-glycine peptidase domain
MELTNQLNKNECGVCVINSYFKHFYKKDIKQKLLNEVVLNENGLSLYEFEVLCNKNNLYCDSYELT